jgi:hypothetical protein
MVNEPMLIHFKEQSVSTPNKFFAKKNLCAGSLEGAFGGCHQSVVAGILPAVSGGILPPEPQKPDRHDAIASTSNPRLEAG